jgi:hypothetical protein
VSTGLRRYARPPRTHWPAVKRPYCRIAPSLGNSQRRSRKPADNYMYVLAGLSSKAKIIVWKRVVKMWRSKVPQFSRVMTTLGSIYSRSALSCEPRLGDYAYQYPMIHQFADSDAHHFTRYDNSPHNL